MRVCLVEPSDLSPGPREGGVRGEEEGGGVIEEG